MKDNAYFVKRLCVLSKKVSWSDNGEGGNTAQLGLVHYAGYGSYDSTPEQYRQANNDAKELNAWTENIVREVEMLEGLLRDAGIDFPHQTHKS